MESKETIKSYDNLDDFIFAVFRNSMKFKEGSFNVNVKSIPSLEKRGASERNCYIDYRFADAKGKENVFGIDIPFEYDENVDEYIKGRVNFMAGELKQSYLLETTPHQNYLEVPSFYEQLGKRLDRE